MKKSGEDLEEFRKEKKVIVIVRDGWGVSDVESGNAVAAAKTPYHDYLKKTYPNILIGASGHYVGVPDGFMGNSEVGHITLGAGRIVLQSLTRINKSIESGEFLRNKNIHRAILEVKKRGSKLHLMCLLQDAGVHSHVEHLYEMLNYAKKEGLSGDDVILHLMTDGRDETQNSGIDFLAELADKIQKLELGWVGTIAGRYYGMDRNANWERTERYYKAVALGESDDKFTCGMELLTENYDGGLGDEFIRPMVKEGYEGFSENKRDSVFFLNFRKDRSRQITKALVEDDFGYFEKREKRDVHFLAMTRYYPELGTDVVYDDIVPEGNLNNVLQKERKKQLRISETEKYAHVTFFFDGGRSKTDDITQRVVVDSPNVATYDLKPEMSSKELVLEAITRMEDFEPDFVMMNFPNPDMVGHSGDFEATVKAVEVVDEAVKEICETGMKMGYTILVTADHGNVEDLKGEWNTSHTTNPVELILVGKDFKGKNKVLKDGDFGLANIAPTVLELMGIERDKIMEESLLK